MARDEINEILIEHERYEASEVLEPSNPFARVLHGWHNDKDYVGPYGLPVDLPFAAALLNFRFWLGVTPPVCHLGSFLEELQRVGAVAELE